MDDIHNDLEQFIERLPHGVIVLDGDLQIKMRNELSITLLEAGLENIVNTDFLDLVKDYPAVKESVLSAHSGDIQRQFCMISLADKILGCTTMRFGDANANELLVLIQDMTNISKIEQIKKEFIATLLHKLRSPLSTLKTSFSMLNREIASPNPRKRDELLEIMEMCSTEVDRLSSLLSDLHDLFRIETNLLEKDIVPEIFPINKAITAAIEAIKKTLPAETEGSRIRFAADSNPEVRADFEKTKKIFYILLKNGVQFSTSGTPVEVFLHKENDSVTATIKDKGIGINAAATGGIFGKYFREDNEVTRNYSGNGLGLFIARSFAEAMHGSVYFETKSGEGTAFHVALPAAGGK